jgi:hypothetical protein
MIFGAQHACCVPDRHCDMQSAAPSVSEGVGATAAVLTHTFFKLRIQLGGAQE